MIKVGFFGTPEISSQCLASLIDEFEILFVVTGEDKPRGRNQKVSWCEAKDTAMCNDVPVYQPRDLRDPEFIQSIQQYKADIYVVVAYGRIIPREIFDYPPLKTINLHPSLLPKYRGAAPVPWALINGEHETGVSVQLINERLDAGDIIIQEKVSLANDMTAGELYDITVPLGAQLLSEAIQLLASGKAEPVPQDESLASYCGKIDKDISRINWNSGAGDIHNLVRGLNPRPLAWTTFKGKNIKIWKTAFFNEETGMTLRPGELYRFKKKHLLVGTSTTCLEILLLQPETKKTMDGPAFCNGHRLEPGDSFDV